MTIYDQIKDKKLKYHIKREAAKLELSLGKTLKYEDITIQEILLPNQSRIIEQDTFRKTSKNNSRPRKTQVETLKVLKSVEHQE